MKSPDSTLFNVSGSYCCVLSWPPAEPVAGTVISWGLGGSWGETSVLTERVRDDRAVADAFKLGTLVLRKLISLASPVIAEVIAPASGSGPATTDGPSPRSV